MLMPEGSCSHPLLWCDLILHTGSSSVSYCAKYCIICRTVFDINLFLQATQRQGVHAVGRDTLRPHTQIVVEHVPMRPSLCSSIHYTHPNQCINMWQMWPTWKPPCISDLEKPRLGVSDACQNQVFLNIDSSTKTTIALNQKNLGSDICSAHYYTMILLSPVHVHPISTMISLPSANTLLDQNSNSEIRQIKLGVIYQARQIGIYLSRHVARRWIYLCRLEASARG